MPKAKKVESVEALDAKIEEALAEEVQVEEDRTEYEIIEVSNGNLFRVYKDKEQAESFVKKFPGYVIK